MRLPITHAGEGQSLSARLDLIVCDAMTCLPPMELEIRGEVKPLRVLLVVDERDERSARIADFVEQRGFELAQTSYAEVTAKLCDEYDVVLADSPLFGGKRVGKHIRSAREFPRTKTPIVAVGFYGTELVEGQGVAMTSGYI